MANHAPIRFHAETVLQCWNIARNDAEAYQRLLNAADAEGSRSLCRAARNAADHIALQIRYGPAPAQLRHRGLKQGPKGPKGTASDRRRRRRTS